MSNLFWLSEAQMERVRPHFRGLTDVPALMIVAC